MQEDGRNPRYKLASRAIKFLLVGGSGMGVDLGGYTLLRWLAVSPPIARALAIWIAMTWNFALNRRWTFSGCERRPLLQQYGLFCLSCLFGALINWSVSLGLMSQVELFARMESLAVLCGVVAGTASNFLLCLKVVFPEGPRDEPGP